MKLNPKTTKDSGIYGKQEQLHEFFVPEDGRYVVANTALQRIITGGGDKGPNAKLRVKPVIFKVIESKAKADEQKDYIFKPFSLELWLTEGKRNQHILNCLILAHDPNYDGDFDTADDGQMVRVLTGVPYVVDIEKRSRKYKDSTGADVEKHEAVATSFLDMASAEMPAELKKKIMAHPDWSKIMGDPGTRMLDTQDFSKPRDGQQGGGSSNAKAAPKNAAQQEEDPFGR